MDMCLSNLRLLDFSMNIVMSIRTILWSLVNVSDVRSCQLKCGYQCIKPNALLW